MERLGLAAGIVVALAACGGGNGGPDTDPDVPPDVPADVADLPAGVDTHEPRVPLSLDQPLRIAWMAQDRLAGTGGLGVDLRVGDPAAPDRSNDVSLNSRLAAVDAALSCDKGCAVDRALRRLAVVTGDSPSQRGVTVQAFTLSDDLVPTPVGAPVDDVRSFHVTGPYLWVARLHSMCPADRGQSGNCYDLVRVPLEPPGPPQVVASFPTPAAMYQSQFGGRFVTSEDGRTLALLNPTFGSVQPWAWREGGEIRPLGDPVCDGTRLDFSGNEVCVETGAAYSDQDPLALSPDGRTLVWAAPWMNRELRLFRDDVLGATPRDHAVLLAVPNDLRKTACYNRTWQFTSVLPSPRFSADGSTVYFVGQSLCGQAPQKPWTNLVSLPLASIAGGRVLARGDLHWVTDFPEEYSPRCVAIQPATVDLDPTGTFAVFAGTPRYQSDGLPIPNEPEAASAHTADAEAWIARLDGTQEAGQITADSLTRTIGTQFAPVD